MAVVINGTTGITSVNGSASAPSVTGTDTDTGIVYGTNTLSLSTGGTTAVTVDSSQNVGIGTNSPSKQLEVNKTGKFGLGNTIGTAAIQFTHSDASALVWQLNSGISGVTHTAMSIGTVASPSMMNIDSSGNVGIGNSSPSTYGKLAVAGSLASIVTGATAETPLVTGLYTGGLYPAGVYTYNSFASNLGHWLTFKVTNTVGTTSEAARIDSSGNLLVGTTTASAKITSNVTGASNNYMAYGDTTTTGAYLYWGYAASASRFIVYGNGGIANVQANNVNLSDRSEKTDFSPAGSYLEKICAIPVQTFKYIDQQDDELNLGVVAQDVQAVAPELVTEGNWGTPDEPKMRLSIYQTDLQYALMKCIQEQQAIIEQLRADVEQLKGQA